MQQFISPLIIILGSGISVYVAMRVALAEIRRDVEALKQADAALQRSIEREFIEVLERIKRLESKYFIN